MNERLRVALLTLEWPSPQHHTGGVGHYAHRLATELASRTVRHFTAGVIVGSRRFIDGWFAGHREWFSGKSATERKSGARSMGRSELRGLYSLRSLRD